MRETDKETKEEIKGDRLSFIESFLSYLYIFVRWIIH